jgi:hypothetical protein
LSSVMCVMARICSRCQGRWQTPDMKREDMAALSSFEGLNCLNTALLSKLLHCSKWPICVPSEDQLQGKLGPQLRNGAIQRRLTQEWRGLKQNQNIEPRVRLSGMPSLYLSYLLLGKLGARQYFQKVSSRETVQSTEKWHKNDVAWNKIRILNHASVCPACRHFICLTCY